jgi:hypothetical protein
VLYVVFQRLREKIHRRQEAVPAESTQQAAE